MAELIHTVARLRRRAIRRLKRRARRCGRRISAASKSACFDRARARFVRLTREGNRLDIVWKAYRGSRACNTTDADSVACLTSLHSKLPGFFGQLQLAAGQLADTIIARYNHTV